MLLPQSTELIVQILAVLASTGGAAAVASWLFVQLRNRYPRPTEEAWSMSDGVTHLIYRLLWSPKYTATAYAVLAATIALTFSLLLNVVRGEPIEPTIDTAIAKGLEAVLAALTGHLGYNLAKPDVVRLEPSPAKDE